MHMVHMHSVEIVNHWVRVLSRSPNLGTKLLAAIIYCVVLLYANKIGQIYKAGKSKSGLCEEKHF